MKNLLVILCLVPTVGVAWGTDTYDAETNRLTIPSVLLGDTVYSNVVITVGRVLSVSGGTLAANYDVYDGDTNVLTIPSVNAYGANYSNVAITPGQVISVGGSKNVAQLPTTNALFDYSQSAPSTCEHVNDPDVFQNITFLALPDPVWVSHSPPRVEPVPSAGGPPGSPLRSGPFGPALVLRAHEISAAWDAPRLAPAIHRTPSRPRVSRTAIPCLVPPGSGSPTHTKAGRAL